MTYMLHHMHHTRDWDVAQTQFVTGERTGPFPGNKNKKANPASYNDPLGIEDSTYTQDLKISSSTAPAVNRSTSLTSQGPFVMTPVNSILFCRTNPLVLDCPAPI
jgi:hypothetical protein